MRLVATVPRVTWYRRTLSTVWVKVVSKGVDFQRVDIPYVLFCRGFGTGIIRCVDDRDDVGSCDSCTSIVITNSVDFLDVSPMW